MNRSRNLTFNVQIWSIIYNKQNVFNSFKKYLCNLKIAKKISLDCFADNGAI